MTDEGADPSVETTAKIVSLGENVSVAAWTFLSAPSDLPSERSVTVMAAGTAVGTAVGSAATAVGAGAGASVFLQATRATDDARTAAMSAARLRVVICPPPD